MGVTLFDVLFFVITLAMPYLFLCFSLVILFFARRFVQCRRTLLWTTLPQFIIYALFIAWINRLGLGIWCSILIFLATAIMLVSQIVMLFIERHYSRPVYFRVVCHLLTLIVFVTGITVIDNHFFSYIHKARLQSQAIELLICIEHDDRCSRFANTDAPELAEEALRIAILDPDVSKVTVRQLLRRIESPFYFRGDNISGENTPFSTAFTRFNVTAVHEFYPLLSGSSEQATRNLDALRQEKRLLVKALKSDYFNKLAFLNMSGKILSVAPMLLDEEAWETALSMGDGDIVRLFWPVHPPERVENLMVAWALLGETDKVVAEINRDPSVLALKFGPYRTLLDRLIRVSDASTIKAIINTGQIDWLQFIEPSGDIPVLEIVFDRATREEDGDVDPLKIILRDLAGRHALPEKQIQRYLRFDETNILRDTLLSLDVKRRRIDSCEKQ